MCFWALNSCRRTRMSSRSCSKSDLTKGSELALADMLTPKNGYRGMKVESTRYRGSHRTEQSVGAAGRHQLQGCGSRGVQRNRQSQRWISGKVERPYKSGH